MKFKLLMITLGFMSLHNVEGKPVKPVIICPPEPAVVSEVAQPVQKIDEILKDNNIMIDKNIDVTINEQSENDYIIEKEEKIESTLITPISVGPVIVEPDIIEPEPIKEEKSVEEIKEIVEPEKDYIVLEDKYTLVWEYKDGIRRVGGENGDLYKWCDETNTYVALDKDGNFRTYRMPTMEEMINGAKCVGSAIFCSESGSYESAKPE